MSNPNGFPRRIDPGNVASYTWEYGGAGRDVTENGKTGTLVGNASASSGVLTLDGTGDYVSTPPPWAANPASMTITGWVKSEDIAATRMAYTVKETNTTNGRGLRVFLRSATGKLRFDTFDAEVGTRAITETTTSIVQSVWYFYSVTHASGTTKIYLDGVEEAETTGEALYTHNYDEARVGGWEVVGFGWSGTIGETRIYSRALSATEIQTIYNDTRGDYP